MKFVVISFTLDEILYLENSNFEKSSLLLSELSEPLRMCLKADLFVANIFSCLNIPSKFKTHLFYQKKYVSQKMKFTPLTSSFLGIQIARKIYQEKHFLYQVT